MAQGGARTATAGAVYPNRSDLSGSADAQYGDRVNQAAVRTATPNTVPAGVTPGQLTPLDAPTNRPNEPITAGLGIGAGPGPGALTSMPTFDDELFDLRALAARFPEYRGLTRLIALAESEK